MPHVDGMSLHAQWPGHGQSRFARPVAAITHAVQSAVAGARDAWSSARAPAADRQLAAHFARATDHVDLERMERDWGRRDGGGVRDWRGG